MLNKTFNDESTTESDESNVNKSKQNIKQASSNSSSANTSANNSKPETTQATKQLNEPTKSTAPIIMDKIKATTHTNNNSNSPNSTVLGQSSSVTSASILPTSASTISQPQHSPSSESNSGENNKQSPSKNGSKNFSTFIKERLLEKQTAQQQKKTSDNLNDVANKIAQYALLSNYASNLANDDTTSYSKSRSPSKSPEELVSNHETALPFSNSSNQQRTTNNFKIKSSSSAIPISNNKTASKEKLSVSPSKETYLINHKPPISPSTPPRIPSPTPLNALISPVKINNFVNNVNNSNKSSTNASSSNGSYGFEVTNSQIKSATITTPVLPIQSSGLMVSKHKQSKSVDLSYSIKDSIIKDNYDFHNSSEHEQINTTNDKNTSDPNNNSLTSNTSLPTANTTTNTATNKTHKNFIIKSAKYSISEPNLSVNLAKSGENSLKLDNSNNKLDFVRQSVSFGDDDDENEKHEDSNNLVHNNNKQQHSPSDISKAQRIFKIRNRLLDENNLIHHQVSLFTKISSIFNI